MASSIRGLVSKKKRRYKEDGFDLDLSYITPRLIAMGFPSSGVEGVYRNPLPEVQRFFEHYHKEHFKIWNLCSERAYDLSAFGEVERFGFDDHNPPSLDMIRPFCESVDRWFAEDESNVAAIHCKAGKGRTGMMISAYLVHSGVCATAEEALRLFAEKRTHNNKGVTIPSQMRYCYYYERILRTAYPAQPTYLITHIRFVTVPNFDYGGGCDPYFVVKIGGKKVYNYRKCVKKLRAYSRDEPFVDLDCSTHDLRVRGDVKLIFYDHDRVGADDKMFHLWFNTGFIEDGYLCFEKSVVDKACKDTKHKLYDPNFKVEIFVSPTDTDAAIVELEDDEDLADGDGDDDDYDEEDDEEAGGGAGDESKDDS
eukprot:PLAT11961.1.p2 GENE.PLAT11961.1~~PLAT11961.1.p2  ORF type:complete len:367 (+),score=184.87 PLAT11961.1:52-1152(+)